ALICIACEQGYVTEKELTEYVSDPDNGLRKELVAAPYRIDLAVRPADLLVAQELRGEQYDSATLNRLRKKYEANLYFIMSISRGGREALHALDDPSAYGDMVQTLSFRMRDYVNLTTSAMDTVYLADFMLNRTYGVAQSTDLLLAFSRDKLQATESVNFNL